MTDYIVPLIIRGRVISDNLVPFGTPPVGSRFLTPDMRLYVDDLVLRNSSGMEDLDGLSLDEVIDYLDTLGRHLAPATNEHIQKALEMNMSSGQHTRPMLLGMYESMRGALYRDHVVEVIDNNIGRQYLEGWEVRTLRDRRVRVRAFGGRTVHMNAGNGPPISMYAVLNGAILRADNIVKIPSNDPFTATAVALTMIDMAPDHPITRHMSVGYWKGGDEDVERRLYRPINIEKIVAWGGAASMNSIRKYLVPGLDLIALDPKLSSSVVGKEAFDTEESMRYVAARMAMDIGAFNQTGCVSSRTIFVESGTDDEGLTQLNRLGRMTFEAMQGLPPELSTHHPAFDPVLRDEISGIRHSSLYEVIGGNRAEGAIIVSQESEVVDFADRLNCRVANLVPIDTIDDVYAFITLDTQTLGVYPESLKDQLRDRCARRGVQRFTSLGCAVFLGMANPHDSLELTRRMARWVIIEDYDQDVIESGAGMCIAG